MIRTLRPFVATAVLVAALGLGARARAGDSAQTFIQSRQSQVSQLLRQSPGSSRDKQVTSVLDDMLDYAELAKRSLAAHWGDLSDPQRKEFSNLLRQLVVRSYEKNIKGILDYDVEYLGEEGATEAVLVHTRATPRAAKSDEPVTIDYRVAPGDGGFRVVDIITEGSSLVGNYRNQFHRIIQKDGVEALLKRMRDKVAKGQTGV